MPQDQELQARVARLIDAGASDDDIRFFIENYQAQAQASAEPPVPTHPLARLGYGLVDAIKNHPAQSGAMAGAAIAAPLTGGLSLLPAAGVVGGASALGAGAGQALSGQTPDPGTMLKEGALGATGEGLGRGAAMLVGKLAPILARGVLKPAKRLQEEFGLEDILQSFLGERVPVGQSARVGARVAQSAGQADDMIRAAEQAGAPPVSVREITGELRPVRDTLKKRARLGMPDETPEVAGRVRAMRAQNQQGVSLTDAQSLKREAQDLSARTFRAIDRGNAIKDTGALADKAIATGLKKGIEKRVPGVKDVNVRTQKLMGLEQALADAESRSPGFMGTNPVTWLGAVAPGTGSKAAFLVDSLSRAPLPGGFRNALLALLGSEDHPQ